MDLTTRKTETGLEFYVDDIFVVEINSLKEWDSVKFKLSDQMIAFAWPYVKERFEPPTQNWWLVKDQISAPNCSATWQWPPHKWEEYCCTDLRCFKKEPSGSFKCTGNRLYHNSTEIARVEQDLVTLTIKVLHSGSIRQISVPKNCELTRELLDRKSLRSIPAVQLFSKL